MVSLAVVLPEPVPRAVLVPAEMLLPELTVVVPVTVPAPPSAWPLARPMVPLVRPVTFSVEPDETLIALEAERLLVEEADKLSVAPPEMVVAPV